MSRWRWPVAAVVAVLVLGTGGYAVAQTRESGPSYRTARASLAGVQRTLDLSGTVSAAGRRDLTFGAAGAVSKVSVRAGRQVRSGQVLARLDPTSFDAAVTAAVATVAKAKAQLASDTSAQADAVTAAASGGSSSGTGSSGAGTATTTKPRTSSGAATPQGQTSGGAVSPAVAKLLAQLTAQQKAVTEAQSMASGAVASAKTALADQTKACQSDSSAEPTPAASPSAGASEEPATGGDSGVSEECTEALATVQAAQDTVAARQDDLQAALTALGTTLGQAVKEVGTSSQAQSPAQPQTQTQAPAQSQGQSQGQSQSQSQGQPASPSAQGGSGSVGGSVTAARLAQDQADIDTAEARLVQARAEREAATLRAPYAGRILRSDITKGDLVSATDPAFVLVGHGTTTVTTSVSTAQVGSVRRGQQATITPAGWNASLHGVVSAIGLLPDSDSAFPVTITVSSTKTVAEGTTASVSIVTGSAEDAVTVPVSALTRRGEQASVQVLVGDKVTTTQVTVGVVGTRRASVTQGLKAGATVVLADLAAEVPSSTTSTTGRFDRAGGAGLGGFPQGGQ